ncbi:MAG: hypothetical protein ABIF40_00430 [archaeon]
MGWKDWPYWLRGGLITLTLSLIIFLVLIIAYPSTVSAFGAGIFVLYPAIFLGPILQIRNEVVSSLFFLIFPFLIYFLIGALGGLMVGKIKSKKD